MFISVHRSEPHLLLDLAEALDGEVQILLGVTGGDLGADAGLAHGHYRVAEARDVDALGQHPGGELLSHLGVVEHDGHDGVLPRQQVEAKLGKLFTEVVSVLVDPVPQRRGRLQQIQRLQAGRADGGGQGVTEEVGPGLLPQQIINPSVSKLQRLCSAAEIDPGHFRTLPDNAMLHKELANISQQLCFGIAGLLLSIDPGIFRNGNSAIYYRRIMIAKEHKISICGRIHYSCVAQEAGRTESMRTICLCRTGTGEIIHVESTSIPPIEHPCLGDDDGSIDVWTELFLLFRYFHRSVPPL